MARARRTASPRGDDHPPTRRQIEGVRPLHEKDPPAGWGEVYLLQAGCDIRTVQKLLGHKDARTTMAGTPVLQQGRLAIRSPLDL